MSIAYASTVLPADPDTVWQVVGNFHGLPAWVSFVLDDTPEGGDGRGPVGSVRRLSLADGRVVGERLVSYDDPGRRYSYEFAEEIPFPARAYRGTVHVLPLTHPAEGPPATFLEWYGEFDCEADQVDELTATFVGLYIGFFTDLRAHLAH